MLRFSLKNQKIPLLTNKELAWRVCLKELLWFINGDTNNNLLKEQNVKILMVMALQIFRFTWFELSKGNDLGPVYWSSMESLECTIRKEFGCSEDYKGKGIDQLQNVIDEINKSKKQVKVRVGL